MDTPELPLPTPKPQSPRDAAADVSADKDQSKQAADLIRQKIDALYGGEPSAKAEIKEIAQQGGPKSVHQQYMDNLSRSGKSVAEIQTAWHEYYQGLSDKAKHEVWEEFYQQNNKFTPKPEETHTHHSESGVTTVSMPDPETTHHRQTHKTKHRATKKQTVADHKQHIVHQTRVKKKLSAKHHFQSLIFGIGTGSIVILILLFGFFNERFIAPFITPSRQVNSTPIIIDPNSAAASNKSVIIIPKINVEIPVIYDEASTAENPMQKALEKGVVHYATTPQPGERGNVAIFGHSSNNLFNPGQYKFAFVLLSKLENGDLFYLDKGGKRYAYKVYKKHVVDPSQVEVLDTQDKPDTATLITCDPPGTSLKRMVVVGEQISPAISKNVASTAKNKSQPKTLPSNAPSLWQRFVDCL